MMRDDAQIDRWLLGLTTSEKCLLLDLAHKLDAVLVGSWPGRYVGVPADRAARFYALVDYGLLEQVSFRNPGVEYFRPTPLGRDVIGGLRSLLAAAEALCKTGAVPWPI